MQGLFVLSAVFVAVTAAIATGDLAWQALDDVAAQRALILYVLGLVHGVLLAASLLARRATPTLGAAPGTDATIEVTPLKCASPPDFEPEHVSPRQLLKDIAATPNPTPTPGVTMTVDEFEVAKAVKRAEASGKVQSRRGKSKSPGGSSSRRRSLRNSKPVELEN